MTGATVSVTLIVWLHCALLPHASVAFQVLVFERLQPLLVTRLSVAVGLTDPHTGKRPWAVVQLRQALAIDPDYADALYNLGYALTSLNRSDEAIAAYQDGRCDSYSTDQSGLYAERLGQIFPVDACQQSLGVEPGLTAVFMATLLCVIAAIVRRSMYSSRSGPTSA